MPSPSKPRHNSPEPEQPKREAILAAALELFNERGFHGTAVPLIAERAEVGTGTLYRYFDTKEALVNAVYQRWKSAYGAYLLRDLADSPNLRETFHRLWSGMFGFLREQPQALAFLELHHHGTYIDAESRAVEEAQMQQLRAIVKEGHRLKLLKPIAADVLIAIGYGAFVGLVRAHQEMALPLPPKVVGEAETAVWDAMSV